MSKYALLKTAILAFEARFSAVNPTVSPIPVELSLDDVIRELKTRLKNGNPLHPPREVIKGQGEFAGYELLTSEPMSPGSQSAKPTFQVSIHTDLSGKTVLTDQRVIAHGIIGLVISEWLAEVEAEEKKKAEAAAPAEGGKIEKFPGAPAADTKA